MISAPQVRTLPQQTPPITSPRCAISNDISLRGLQGRTDEWTQGKILEATTPVGPWLATPDEFRSNAELTTLVNGEVRQRDSVDDLVSGWETYCNTSPN